MANNYYLDKDGLTYYHSKVIGLIPSVKLEINSTTSIQSNPIDLTTLTKGLYRYNLSNSNTKIYFKFTKTDGTTANGNVSMFDLGLENGTKSIEVEVYKTFDKDIAINDVVARITAYDSGLVSFSTFDIYKKSDTTCSYHEINSVLDWDETITDLDDRVTNLEGKTIPTKTSELENDSGFVTTDTTYSAGTNISISEANVINGKSNSSIVDLIYPVGAIYMSVNNTNPSTLFGGTWEQIKDKFILSAGDTYSGGATGGSSSQKFTPSGSVENHTLTTSELPKHTHGLNEHTHSYDKSATATAGNNGNTGASNVNTGSTTLTGAQSGIQSHRHKGLSWVGKDSTESISLNGGSQKGYNLHFSGNNNGGWTNIQTYASGASNATSGHTHTLNNHTHSLNNHTHSITLTSTASGKASGSTASTGSGTAHNHGFTGTEATINTLPPYLALYVWKRTA